MHLARTSKSIFVAPLAYRLGRWALACVFIWSGAAKLPDLQGFAALISDYGIVPEATVYFSAVVLVTLELVAGVGLALDIRGSLTLTAALLAIFGVVLAYGIWLGLEIECGCFGLGGSERAQGETLAGGLSRDLAWLALCGYLYCFRALSGVRPRSLMGAVRRALDSREPSGRHEIEN